MKKITDKYSGLELKLAKNLNLNKIIIMHLCGASYTVLHGQDQAEHVAKFLEKSAKFIRKNKNHITKPSWLD